MSSPRRLRNSTRPAWPRIAAWVGAGLLLVGVVATLGIKSWVESYLKSERFRSFVAAKAGATLKAEAEVAPLTFSGQSFYSDGFQARGTKDSWFSFLELDQVRAEVSTRRFTEHVWQVDQVEIQRAQIRIEGDRLPSREALKHESQTQKSPSFFSGWIPNRVEVGAATIHEAAAQWKDGGISGTSVQVTPKDEGWNIVAQGGHLQHGTLPALEAGAMKLRYREPSLFVQDAEFRQAGGGTAHVSGEVRFGQAADLIAKLEGISMTPYLAGDWRARLHGKVSGDVRVETDLPVSRPPRFSGALSISEGQLEALPVLDEIAAFTRTAQFRRLAITRASGRFQQQGGRLVVQDLVAESEGLIRMEGTFTVENEMIDGTLQVGVTPASLQWLPGSQARVFTVSRGGYLWTPLRLTGPLDQPKEDLSPRLIAAAKGAILDSAGDAVRGATESARGAARRALDLLLGK